MLDVLSALVVRVIYDVGGDLKAIPEFVGLGFKTLFGVCCLVFKVISKSGPAAERNPSSF